MDILTGSLNAQKIFSLDRLEKLKQEIKAIGELKKHKNYCIYVTGSYGRLEATEYSDLDLFFITGGSVTKKPIPQLSKTLIDAELIKLLDRMGFPPFSNDGQFLQIHYLKDIELDLGSPRDDFNNFFTARLLLLLESSPLYNEKFYDKSVLAMIKTYYRDFHKHTTDFLPIFLVNDVIRYWKTLCLNYEHRRNTNPPDKIKKLKTHVKNLKLVFSRKLTCYSFIIQIVANYKVLSEEKVLEIVKMTPIQRLLNVAEIRPEIKPLVKEIFELYSWFIDVNNQPASKLLNFIDDNTNRDLAFNKGRNDFGDKLFQLLIKLTDGSPEILKYLVI